MARTPPTPQFGEPWWHSQTSVVAGAKLEGDQRCDVVVVGGGVAGLHAALRLSACGADVVLLERDICGGGMSGRSSGFLTPDSELGLHQLMGRFGAAEAATLWRIAADGAALIVDTARAEAIACDLQSVDCLFVGIGESGATTIRAEAEARAAVGFDYQLMDEPSLAAVHPGGYQAGLAYGDTEAADPFAYCRGLRDVLIERGVQVYEGSPVTAIEGSAVVTERATVHADRVVVCLDRMPPSINARASEQIYHAQTVLCVSEPLSAVQIAALFPRGRFQVWDSTAVYSYYRLTGDDRLLLGGGSALTTFARDPLRSPGVIRAVIRGFRARFPDLGGLRFTRWWPGLIDVTRDLLPVIDADPEEPTVQYVFGCAGLPWAAWGGDHAARRIMTPGTEDLTRFFGWSREALVPSGLQGLLGKPLSFAIDILDARRVP
ncbi:MAG: FAD-binding oxidoreductase [Pseudomonadota bacterium]|nr:FAD-binding oxidoreductase [Pseudomonadota bacterium]